MSPEETIADRIFKKCVQYGRDGLWFDRLKAAAIIKHTMAAEKALRHDAMTAYAKLEADWRGEKALREAAETRAAGLIEQINEYLLVASEAADDLRDWRQLGNYQRERSPDCSRDPLCATDVGLSKTNRVIRKIGAVNTAARALLAPALDKLPALDADGRDNANWRLLYRELYCRIWYATEEEFEEAAIGEGLKHSDTLNELVRMLFEAPPKHASAPPAGLPPELDKASPPAKIAPSPHPGPEPPKLGEDMSTAEMTWRELHDQVVNQSDGSIVDLVTGVIDSRDPRSQATILWGIAQQVLPELVRDAASEREWGMVSELGDAGAGFDAAMTEYIGEDPAEPPV